MVGSFRDAWQVEASMAMVNRALGAFNIIEFIFGSLANTFDNLFHTLLTTI